MSGEVLAPQLRTVTARDIAMGAAASRDWQPQHHDNAHARAMNLPDVIMNTPTQTGWLHAYALRWAGPAARIGRWSLAMLRPICPGMEVMLTGKVTHRAPAGSCDWCWLDLAMEVGGTAHSRMQVLLALSAGDSEIAEWPPLSPL